MTATIVAVNVFEPVPGPMPSALCRPVRASNPPSKHKGRVLLVDDDLQILKLYGRILRDAGFAVVEAPESHVAADLMIAHEFDVVVTDVVMPRINGVEILRAVHEHDPDMPVVLMSGTANLEPGDGPQAGRPGNLEAGCRTGRRCAPDYREERLALQQYSDRWAEQASRADLIARFEHALAGVRMVFQPIVPSPTEVRHSRQKGSIP
jgi:CheY-like chemotaxis protein